MFGIHKDIKKSNTLPSEFYRSSKIFDQVIEKIFTRSWHYAIDSNEIQSNISIRPTTLLPHILDEPILFTKDKNGEIHCLSNVCTHRGMILIEEGSKSRIISCKYHGRCFRLDGSFKSMPAFEQAENFPCDDDHLPKIPFYEWAGMLFHSLHPKISFEEMIRPIQERLSFLPLEHLIFDATTSKDYHIKANWALYCDNYLEGLHIPFVHPALNSALDFDNYAYEIYPYCNLQLGIGENPEQCFSIPEGHPDYGKNIYAYYFWLFPNIMINVYPSFISMNIVKPTSIDTTQVSFRTYLFSHTENQFQETQIHQTELEDEWVVERVQKGIQSQLYKRGRFSPSMEKGVHHFHYLIQEWMNS